MVEKSLFTKLDHVGVVVRDMGCAVKHYQFLGIGPFEPSTLGSTDRKLRGKPADDIHQEVRKAMIGQLGLQLIRPISGESPQKEFLESKGEGINHIAFLVDNLDEAVAKMVKKGYKIIYSAKYTKGGGEVYLDTAEVGGFYIQLFQWP